MIYICDSYNYHMKERILAFLKAENKSSSQFAEDIGVQPSGISHILSGRNKPSLDFVIKMLEKYPFISTQWLLFGKGSMYNEPSLASLFEDHDAGITRKVKEKPAKPEEKVQKTAGSISGIDDSAIETDTDRRKSGINKIIWFYDDNSFEEFYPHKD